MEYSIIVPFHSNRQLLELCLRSLNQTIPQETEIVVIMNNNNEDEIKFMVDVDKNNVKVERIKKNLGYAGAINWGTEIAKGKYLIFCDHDTFYFGNWFKNLTKFYHSDIKIGSASSKLLNPYNSRIVDYGIAFTEYNAPHPFMDSPCNYKLAAKNRKVQAACSANMIIEKELFEYVNKFEDKPHSYYNDISLSLKLKDIGKECWVVGDAIAYHKSSFWGVKPAPYKNPSIKGDQKGYFMAKYWEKIEIDMDRYFAENFDYFNRNGAPNLQYLLIDMTNIVDHRWHHDIIKKYFRIVDIYEQPTYNRDSLYISLFDHLSLNILYFRIPIIYFVDRYISLQQNTLWFHLRDNPSDIVIDRNANISRFKDLISRNYDEGGTELSHRFGVKNNGK